MEVGNHECGHCLHATVARMASVRAWAGLVPDCLVLARRLVADRRVRRRVRVLLGALALYLASPIDLVPDFIPVLGHLDDALVAALVLRVVVRSAGPDLIRLHWPGPAESLEALLRLAGGPAREGAERKLPSQPA